MEMRRNEMPPFTRPPVIMMLDTNTIAVMTDGDRTWVRVKGTKMWRAAKNEDINKISQIFEDFPQSAGKKAGVAIGVTVFVAVVMIVAAVLVVKNRRRICGRGRGYEEIQSAAEF